MKDHLEEIHAVHQIVEDVQVVDDVSSTVQFLLVTTRMIDRRIEPHENAIFEVVLILSDGLRSSCFSQ